MIDLFKLKALALLCRRKKWVSGGIADLSLYFLHEDQGPCLDGDQRVATATTYEYADFIEAANPETVYALVERIEELESKYTFWKAMWKADSRSSLSLEAAEILEKMQTPKSRDGVERAFHATVEGLSEAASNYMRHEGEYYARLNDAQGSANSGQT